MRSLDLFAVHVQLSYKGRRAFSTAAGGCISLILVLSFLSYAAYTLHGNLMNPVLKSSDEFNYTSLEEYFLVPTTNSTVAVQITNGEYQDVPQDEISKHLRVMFSDHNSTISAVYCQDLYAEEIKAEEAAGFLNGTFTQ